MIEDIRKNSAVTRNRPTLCSIFLNFVFCLTEMIFILFSGEWPCFSNLHDMKDNHERYFGINFCDILSAQLLWCITYKIPYPDIYSMHNLWPGQSICSKRTAANHSLPQGPHLVLHKLLGIRLGLLILAS